jgi:hypothetical protein
MILLPRKYPLGKSEDTSDKSIYNIFVINSYPRNNLGTNKDEKKNIFGDSFGFTLKKENGMKYVVRNDTKFEIYGMKKITMESSSNGKIRRRNLSDNSLWSA